MLSHIAVFALGLVLGFVATMGLLLAMLWSMAKTAAKTKVQRANAVAITIPTETRTGFN